MANKTAVKEHIASVLKAPGRTLDAIGRQGIFYGNVFKWVYRVIVRYKREQLRLIAEVGMGSGALALVGGSVAITGFLTFFAATNAGVQAYYGLNQVGLTALSGFASAFINTRLAAPLIAGAGLAATVGTGITAQLGSMRINEEIDALETMGIRSLPYLVSTRLVAGFVTVIPLYAASVILSYVGYKAVTVLFYHVSSGAYDHYFYTFLQPIDLLYSFVQAIALAIVVILVHCYYGYTATGGPAGVGEAVGRAVRASLISISTVNLLVAMALWGGTKTLHISG
ncbi:MlaE family ABC transporter permease [Sciscionella marina]|uniref:MlaE family ABC transporter permease n=1 Tax=Sciscionella marina TaxID=508770 RepID=UPI000364271A|nr:ABC transporter permease [Sciscionella marina]